MMEEYYLSNTYKNQEEHFMRSDGKYPPVLCVSYIVCPVLSAAQLYHASIKKRIMKSPESDLYDDIDMPQHYSRLIISRNEPEYLVYKDVCELRGIWFLDY